MVLIKKRRGLRVGRKVYAKRRPMNISRPTRRLGIRGPRLVMKRTKYDSSWTYSAASTTDFWRYQTFTTGAINNFAELANVFDSYKINAIKQTWRPRYDNVDASVAAANTKVYAHVIVDPDSTLLVPTGAQSQTTLNTFLEQGDRVKTFDATKPFSIYFKPKIQMQGLGGDTQSMVKSAFLKTTNTVAVHRGYHMYLAPNNLTAAPNLVLDSYITVYFTMKDLK